MQSYHGRLVATKTNKLLLSTAWLNLADVTLTSEKIQKAPTACLHLYEVQKLAKGMYGVRNQDNAHLWNLMTEKGAQGSLWGAGTIFYLVWVMCIHVQKFIQVDAQLAC